MARDSKDLYADRSAGTVEWTMHGQSLFSTVLMAGVLVEIGWQQHRAGRRSVARTRLDGGSLWRRSHASIGPIPFPVLLTRAQSIPDLAPTPACFIYVCKVVWNEREREQRAPETPVYCSDV